jgi:hypothetical protein
MIGKATQDFKMRFGDCRLKVNYYYPPDDGFLVANGKKLLHEVIGRIFKPGSPLNNGQNYECIQDH